MGVQLREDVTRFRYGDEQHLDDTLTRLFQFNRPKGVPRRCASNRCIAHVICIQLHHELLHVTKCMHGRAHARVVG